MNARRTFLRRIEPLHVTVALAVVVALLAVVAAGAGCAPAARGLTIALPERTQALSEQQRAQLVATLEIPGVLAESALTVSDDGASASGRFDVGDSAAGTHAYVVRLSWRPEDSLDGSAPSDVLLARLDGTVRIAAHEDNALSPSGDFDTCGADAAGACALRFDLNRNGVPNLDDMLNADGFVDPRAPAPFIDTSPADLPFPSGIRLGSFARQVVVVENTADEPVAVTARLIDAPGVTLSRYQTTFDPANSAKRELDLGTLEPFQEVLLAVSFAPVNAFLTVGDVFVEAENPRTHVKQARRIRLLANADGALQPPPPSFVAPTAPSVDVLGVPAASIQPFDSAALWNGLPISSVASEGEAAAPGLARGGPVVDLGGRSVAADAAFVVEVPAGHKLAASLSQLDSDVDLAVVPLDDADAPLVDRALVPGKSGDSAEAIELRNDDDAPLRALVLLGRVDEDAPAQAGGLSVDERAPFSLSCHVTNTPELTAPPDPLTGPLEGGTRVTLRGRGFHPSARVSFADALALDCGLTDGVDAEGAPEQRIDCTTPPGSLLIGKNPATIVVENPGANDGGDGQAATLPEGFAYEPPAPRLDDVVPAVAPTTGSGGDSIVLRGAFFSRAQAPPQVSFGSAPAATVTFIDSTRLEVIAPEHEAGVVAITVRNVLAVDETGAAVRLSLSSNARNFTYVQAIGEPPTIATVAPGQVSIEGGATITVSGAHFDDDAVVLIDGDEAPDTDFVSSTTLTALVPPRAGDGDVDVAVVNADGRRATLSLGLHYFIPDPEIDSVFPASASTSGGTFVVVNGRGFAAGTAVDFVRDAAVHTSPNVNRVSSTTLLVATPAVDTSGSYDVRVRSAGKEAVVTGSFTFVAPTGAAPVIASLDPNNGDKDLPPVVTLRGRDFRSPSVLVGTEAVELLSTDTAGADDSVTFVAPRAAQTGAVVVRLINDDGQSDTAVFTYFQTLGAPPSIDLVSPSRAARGAQLTLLGRNFDVDGGGALRGSLLIGGRVQAPTSASAGRIVAAMPDLDSLADDGDSIAVEVTNPDGQGATAVVSYVEATGPTPAITSISPATQQVGARTVLSGSGFSLDRLQVGGVVLARNDLAIAEATATSIAFDVPNPGGALPAQVVVRVVNVDGQSASTALTVTAPAAAPPRIDSLSPDSGPPSGGTVVVVRGAGFDAGAAVRVAGVPATVTARSTTQLTFTTPPAAGGAEGLAAVLVQNSDAQSASTSFRYLAPQVAAGDPAIGFVSPQTLHAGVPGDVVTIVGANLARVTSASLRRPPEVVSATVLSTTDVSVTVQVDGPLDDAAPYSLRLTTSDGKSADSAPLPALRPRVAFAIEEDGGRLIFVGEEFNAARLDGTALLDTGNGSQVQVVIDSATEGLVSATALAELVPGARYQLLLSFGGGAFVVPARADTGAALSPRALDLTTPNGFLPSGADLDGVHAAVFVGTRGPSPLAAFGVPAGFDLLAANGTVLATGQWIVASASQAVDLTFDATGPLPEGPARVRLRTSLSPNLAEGDAFVLSPRAVSFVIDPQPVMLGERIGGFGVFLAGDRIYAERIGSGERATIGQASSSAFRPPPGGAGGFSDGQFNELSTTSLLAGQWRMCAAGPTGALPPCTTGVIIDVAQSSCAAPIDVGVGRTVRVPLQGSVRLRGCDPSNVVVGEVLRMTLPQSAQITVDGRSAFVGPLRTLIGTDVCNEQLTIDRCGTLGSVAAQEPLFVPPGTHELIVYSLDPAALGSDVVVQFTAQSGQLCLAGDADFDGATPCAFDCDDANPNVHPGAADLCDGVDDDCNAIVDDIKQECAVGGQIGSCAIGAARCQAGAQVCDQVTFPGQRREVCQDLVDNDCDTATDEGDCVFARVSRYTPNNCTVVDVSGIIGDDRPGIWVSDTSVFVNGDGFSSAAVSRFDLADLAGGTTLGKHDATVVDLATGSMFALVDQFGVEPSLEQGNLVVERLQPLDPATLVPTGGPLPLSQPLFVSGGGELFSGAGFFVLHDASLNMFVVDVQTGFVQPLGVISPLPQRSGAEGWASYGVAERVGTGRIALSYATPFAIARVELPSRRASIASSFGSLGDLASFVSHVATGRWYWRHEGGSALVPAGGDEHLGFCDAIVCGDSVCAPGQEDAFSCPEDCNAVCGNSTCEAPSETPATCPADCAPTCGNGACDDFALCPQDCPGAIGFCGDGWCGQDDPAFCPGDCGAPVSTCGNGSCEPLFGEDPVHCPSDCT